MKRHCAALLLMMMIFTALIGCSEGAHVEKGGGETAVLELNNNQPTGRIDVRGHVVNTGGNRADDVVLYFKFYQGGALYLEEKIRLGSITVGGSREFVGVFSGQPVRPDTFTWEYRIEWD